MLKNAYLKLITFGNFLQDPLLLICRLYWGSSFMLSGFKKLTNISEFQHLLETYSFPIPYGMALLASGAEFFCGICLLIGFASRLAAIPLIITMLTAYLTVHVKVFETPSLIVKEAPFNFLLISLLVLAFGPGKFSIDHLIKKYRK